MAPFFIKHVIEFPISGQLPSRRLTIRGWCFDSEGGPLKGIRARVGDRVFKASRKQARPNIGRVYPHAEEAGRSGFEVEVELPGGRSEVVLDCRTGDGAWHTFETLALETPRFFWPWRKQVREEDLYALWIERHDRLDAAERARIAGRVASWVNPPKISIVVPIYNTPQPWLGRMIESVREQLYPNWELCLADDRSSKPHVRPALEEAMAADDRIRVLFREENGHISAATNSAIELATGEYLALLDHDDEIPPHALYWVAEEIRAHPEVDVIFTDEDKMDTKGRRSEPYFKPDYNYDLFLSQNCISHLGVFRTDLVRQVGGFRVGMEGSQDWDLTLRVIEKTTPERVRHIPRILYHWRQIEGSTSIRGQEKPYAAVAAIRAVSDHLERTGRTDARVVGHESTFARVLWPLPDPVPPVTLIMPTRNYLPLLRVAARCFLEKTDYPDLELLIVDNDSDDPETLAYLDELPKKDPRARVLRVSGEFNYARLNNLAVAETDRPVICLVNNDLETIGADWLREMVSQALRPEIGAVGAKLYYPSGKIQHAGVVIGMTGCAGHPFRGVATDYKTPGGRSGVVQNWSAVTAACLAVERRKYLEVGGMDEETFAVALNDVDFCLKLKAAGYRNLYTPFAELIHHESASRGASEKTPARTEAAARENAAFAAKWPDLFDHDPAWNPNLALDTDSGGLAFPPNEIHR